MADRPRVPDGFQELLEELSYEVLKQRPSDFIQFSIDFLQSRRGPNGTFITKRTTSGFANDDPLRNNRDLHFNSCPQNNHCADAITCGRSFIASENIDSHPLPKSSDIQKFHKSEEQATRLNNAIQRTQIFKDLNENELSTLFDSMFEVQVNAGDEIIKRGDDGDKFYVIDSGKFYAEVNEDGVIKRIAEYDGSGYFGELALIYNIPRFATVTAETSGTLWALDRDSFRGIIFNSAYLRRQCFEGLLKKVEIFKSLSPYQQSQLADALQTKTVGPSEVIIKEGEPGNEVFFINKGAVQVYKEDGDKMIDLAELKDGEYFGELALIKKQPRAATVAAKTEVELAVLNADNFEKILGQNKDQLMHRIDSYSH
ncbi:unnamed protein product [Schistocephalus solidus]|uniref:cAMP-dependent protein kinase type II regulatory subunit n=1 Tax=Schistocephalus solidus TaxID=70667 RepID=A0A0X3PF49_SCHSO|nr:unnamed protein product [Schistocephalus solidus]